MTPPTLVEKLLLGLLFLTSALPALVFSWGREGGELAFVIYREPKLVAAAVLGWLLLAIRLWTWRWEPGLPAAFQATLRRPQVVALGAWLAYLGTTGAWVLVPENFLYELNQYVLAAGLVLVLLVWTAKRPAVAGIVRAGLVTSLGVVTAVGLVQAVVPLRVLTPINPEIGAVHPSFMGYKNPAALAVLGQLFLLAELVFRREGPAWRRGGLLLLLLAELGYLVSLGSRTSYVGLAAAVAFFVLLQMIRRPSLRTLGVGAGFLAAFGLALWIHSPIRERAATLLSYLASPRAYLESDRGTYLLNTVEMARHRPFGVGLGDWQTQYPVFRRYNREVAFSDEFQARRAHSDHVQLLGESGWPGLLLWGAFLVILIGSTAREYLRSGRAPPLFASAQLVAFAVAMAGDYLLELPYNKFQFFLVVFLAIATLPTVSGTVPDRTRRARTLVALTVSVVALLQFAYHVSLIRKVHAAAALEWSYQRATEKPELLAETLVRGVRFAGLLGHTKTFYKDYLLLGHVAYLTGRRREALAATSWGLHLHPYSPNGLRLMSELVEDDEAATRWKEAYLYVMKEASEGFRRPYPGSLP